jgi:hypothetical protein
MTANRGRVVLEGIRFFIYVAGKSIRWIVVLNNTLINVHHFRGLIFIKSHASNYCRGAGAIYEILHPVKAPAHVIVRAQQLKKNPEAAVQ